MYSSYASLSAAPSAFCPSRPNEQLTAPLLGGTFDRTMLVARLAASMALLQIAQCIPVPDDSNNCQCDPGSYWCAIGSRNRLQFNCSGSSGLYLRIIIRSVSLHCADARSLWGNISHGQSKGACADALASTCDALHGAHGHMLQNSTWCERHHFSCLHNLRAWQ